MGLSVSTHNRTNDISVNSFLKELNNSYNGNRQSQRQSFRNISSSKFDSTVIKEKLDHLMHLEESYNGMFKKSGHGKNKHYGFEKLISEYNQFSKTIQDFFGIISSELGIDMNNFTNDLNQLINCRIILIECIQSLCSTELIQVNQLLQLCLKLQKISAVSKMPFVSIFSKSVNSDVDILQCLVYSFIYISSFKPLDAILQLDHVTELLETSDKLMDVSLSYYTKRLYLINSSIPHLTNLRLFFNEFRDLIIIKFGLYFDELYRQIHNDAKTPNSFMLKISNLSKKLKFDSVYLLAHAEEIDGLVDSAFYLRQNTDPFHILFHHKTSVSNDVNWGSVGEALSQQVGPLYRVGSDDTPYLIKQVEENVYLLFQINRAKLNYKVKGDNVKSIQQVINTVNLTNFLNGCFQ